jgi:hypothetical protein
MTEADSKPRRHWFRFSLRTLLVALMLPAVWCGYYAQWAANRRQARDWIDAHRIELEGSHPGVFRELTWQLKLFGESPNCSISVHVCDESPEQYQHDIERLARLFPEADIFDGETRHYATPVSAVRSGPAAWLK